LQGVNRALPYVASSEVDDIVEVQTPILFRLVIFLDNVMKYLAKFVFFGQLSETYHFGFV
jgi:hypothetical protein